MGNSNSNRHAPKEMRMTAEQMAAAKRIHWAMPSWCIDNYVVTMDTIELASASWRYAMSGEAEPFLAAKKKEPSLTPLVFFYNQFYYFLFELLPDVRPLFTRGMKAQGRMLANVIKYIITNLSDSDETALKTALEHLARLHNVLGITADQYSVMGMCLIHTVRICTGPKFWSIPHKNAWVHIYSKMMSIIIPIVIRDERPSVVVEGGINFTSLEYYKNGNLNKGADGSSKKDSNTEHSHSHTPPTHKTASTTAVTRNGTAVHKQDTQSHLPGHQPSPTSVGGSGGCPMVSGSENDPDASPALQQHLKDNATAHLEVLSAEARAEAAVQAEQKYKVLARVLAISQRVETHLRQTISLNHDGHALPMGSITGHQLIKLLAANNWVSDTNGAKMACSYFLQLHLMQREGVTTSRTLAADQDDAVVLNFNDDHTIYTFAHAVASLTPPATGSTAHTPMKPGTPNSDVISALPRKPTTAHSSNSFNPQCYVGEMKPVHSILNALSPPTELPGALKDVKE